MTVPDVYQLMGLVFASAGLGMLFAPAFYYRMTEQIDQNAVLVYMGGVIRVVLGYLLIRYYTYWGWDWRLLLTIIGWIALIAGLLILLLPQQFLRVAIAMMRSRKSIQTYAVIATIIGFFFMYLGFFALK